MHQWKTTETLWKRILHSWIQQVIIWRKMCTFCKSKTYLPLHPQKSSNAANLTKTCLYQLFPILCIFPFNHSFLIWRLRMFGNNCAPCPTNCEENKCQHGKCFACKPGWVGMFCNKSMISEIIQLISHLWLFFLW